MTSAALTHAALHERVNKNHTRAGSELAMADDFVLTSLLSTFLDDPHEIPSELDVSALSQKEVETQINRTLAHPRRDF